jgi:hypothetical protein
VDVEEDTDAAGKVAVSFGAVFVIVGFAMPYIVSAGVDAGKPSPCPPPNRGGCFLFVAFNLSSCI